MAFVIAVPVLPRNRTQPSCPRTRTPVMLVDQTAVVTLATMAVGIGGGIGLVAWTENQGKRTDLRPNVQVCVECLGETVVPCNLCNATGKDPLNEANVCSYCDGKGYVQCFNCNGTGIQPRFLDRLSPDDFMD